MKTRREAAIELNEIFNAYEVRKNTIRTTYRKIYKRDGLWKLVGFAHDYTL